MPWRSRPFRAVVPATDVGPVDDIPPGGEIVGATVLVLEIVGVLPHVAAQDRTLAVHERAVLVGSALDAEAPAPIRKEPAPPAAKPADARLLELLLELREAAERLGDRLGERAARFLGPTGRHHFPEHRVIDVAAAVVPDRRPDCLGQRI